MNKTARNAEYIKQYNRKKILSLLSRESLSRAELARRTGLTRSAISIITDELLGYQILMEHEAVAQKRGRSPAPLSLNPVSYTHLDVYKRQTLGRAKRNEFAFCRHYRILEVRGIWDFYI